jgi:chemosensory pili system protein ChpA (sensor histidine kinase/response regulator)
VSPASISASVIAAGTISLEREFTLSQVEGPVFGAGFVAADDGLVVFPTHKLVLAASRVRSTASITAAGTLELEIGETPASTASGWMPPRAAAPRNRGPRREYIEPAPEPAPKVRKPKVSPARPKDDPELAALTDSDLATFTDPDLATKREVQQLADRNAAEREAERLEAERAEAERLESERVEAEIVRLLTLQKLERQRRDEETLMFLLNLLG